MPAGYWVWENRGTSICFPSCVLSGLWVRRSCILPPESAVPLAWPFVIATMTALSFPVISPLLYSFRHEVRMFLAVVSSKLAHQTLLVSLSLFILLLQVHLVIFIDSCFYFFTFSFLISSEVRKSPNLKTLWSNSSGSYFSWLWFIMVPCSLRLLVSLCASWFYLMNSFFLEILSEEFFEVLIGTWGPVFTLESI